MTGKLHYVHTVCPLVAGVSSPSVSWFQPVCGCLLPAGPLRLFTVWDNASWLFVTAPRLLLIS